MKKTRKESEIKVTYEGGRSTPYYGAEIQYGGMKCFGKTPKEAIGQLVIQKQKELGIKISYRDKQGFLVSSLP